MRQESYISGIQRNFYVRHKHTCHESKVEKFGYIQINYIYFSRNEYSEKKKMRKTI